MVATCAPGIPFALRHAVFGIERIARRTAGLRAAAMAKSASAARAAPATSAEELPACAVQLGAHVGGGGLGRLGRPARPRADAAAPQQLPVRLHRAVGRRRYGRPGTFRPGRTVQQLRWRARSAGTRVEEGGRWRSKAGRDRWPNTGSGSTAAPAGAPTRSCSSIPRASRGPARERRQQAAAAICAGCVVRTQCRAYALAAAEPYGVWGGLSESARDAILGRPARAS